MHGLPELSETSTLSQREQELLNGKTVSAGARPQSSTANSPTEFPSQRLMRKIASRCRLCLASPSPEETSEQPLPRKPQALRVHEGSSVMHFRLTIVNPSLKTAAPPTDQNETSKRRTGKSSCHQDTRDDVSTFLVDNRGFHRISSSSRHKWGETLQPRIFLTIVQRRSNHSIESATDDLTPSKASQ